MGQVSIGGGATGGGCLRQGEFPAIPGLPIPLSLFLFPFLCRLPILGAVAGGASDRFGGLGSARSSCEATGAGSLSGKKTRCALLRWRVLSAIGLRGQTGRSLDVSGEMAIVLIADHGRDFVNPHLSFGQQAGDIGNSRSCQLFDDRASQLGVKLIIQGAMRKVGYFDNIRYSDWTTGVFAYEAKCLPDIDMANHEDIG